MKSLFGKIFYNFADALLSRHTHWGGLYQKSKMTKQNDRVDVPGVIAAE
jgi:hypothetical protein